MKKEMEQVRLHLRRQKACQEAMTIMAEADTKERRITEKQVLKVLRLWGFKKNESRKRVRPLGSDFVHSDTLGLVKEYRGSVKLSRCTLEYPQFMSFLCRWLRDNYEDEFAYTSISVNSTYCARRHRDLGNVGPSLIKAFGNFEGGRLYYWPYDEATIRDPADPARSKRPRVQDLDETRKLTLDVKAEIHLFDGRRAHEVEPFTGHERFSLVFYTTNNYQNADCYLRFLREDFEVPLPRSQRMGRLNDRMDAMHKAMQRRVRRAMRRQHCSDIDQDLSAEPREGIHNRGPVSHEVAESSKRARLRERLEIRGQHQPQDGPVPPVARMRRRSEEPPLVAGVRRLQDARSEVLSAENKSLRAQNHQLQSELLNHHRQRERDTRSMLNTVRPHADVLHRQVRAIRNIRHNMLSKGSSLNVMLREIQQAIQHQVGVMASLTDSCALELETLTQSGSQSVVQS